MELKDNTTLIISDGEFVMLSSTLDLYDTCSFIVKGGNVDLNNQFNINGGSISFDQNKFKSGDRQIILTSKIPNNVITNNKLKFIIDSETIDNSKSVNDDRYVLRSDFDKKQQELLDEKQKEIDRIKSEFLEKMDLKEKQYMKQISLLKKQGMVEQIMVNDDDTTKSNPVPSGGDDVSNVAVNESLPQVVLPDLVTTKYSLTFNYDSDTNKLTPIIETDTSTVKETDDSIDTVANTLATEILSSSIQCPEIQKLLSKIYSLKYSKILRKAIDLIRQQCKTTGRNAFLTLREKEKLRQRRINRTYTKTLNSDNTTTVNKLKTDTTTSTKDTNVKKINIKKALDDLNNISRNYMISIDQNASRFKTPSTDSTRNITRNTNTTQKSINKRKLISNVSNVSNVKNTTVKHKKRLV